MKLCRIKKNKIEERNNGSLSPELTVPRLVLIREQEDDEEIVKLLRNKDQPKDGHPSSQYFLKNGVLMRKWNPQKMAGKKTEM